MQVRDVGAFEVEDRSFVVQLGAEAFARFSSHSGASMRAALADPAARVAVAELAGDRAGFAIVQFTTLRRAFGPIARPRTAHLSAIAVAPDARGHGLGAELLAWSVACARDEGAVVLSLTTAVDNPARRLFVRGGFAAVAPLGATYRGGRHAVSMMRFL